MGPIVVRGIFYAVEEVLDLIIAGNFSIQTEYSSPVGNTGHIDFSAVGKRGRGRKCGISHTANERSGTESRDIIQLGQNLK